MSDWKVIPIGLQDPQGCIAEFLQKLAHDWELVILGRFASCQDKVIPSDLLMSDGKF